MKRQRKRGKKKKKVKRKLCWFLQQLLSLRLKTTITGSFVSPRASSSTKTRVKRDDNQKYHSTKYHLVYLKICLPKRIAQTLGVNTVNAPSE